MHLSGGPTGGPIGGPTSGPIGGPTGGPTGGAWDALALGIRGGIMLELWLIWRSGTGWWFIFT